MAFKDDIIAIIDYIDKQDTHSSCIHGTHILVLHENLNSNISKARLTTFLLNQTSIIFIILYG